MLGKSLQNYCCTTRKTCSLPGIAMFLQELLDQFAFLDWCSAFSSLVGGVNMVSHDHTGGCELCNLSISLSIRLCFEPAQHLWSRHLSQAEGRERESRKCSSGPEGFIPLVSEDLPKCSTWTAPSKQFLNSKYSIYQSPVPLLTPSINPVDVLS